ncbi:MAG: leucine-rich repeat domain-containing protein [Pseudomonadota bacterium]
MADPDFPSPKAEDAFRRAEALIERAIAEGKTKISFSGYEWVDAAKEKLPHLTSLPKQILEIKDLTLVDLEDTQASDQAAETLAQAPNLQTLYLSNTQVTDKAAEALAQAPNLQTLTLNNTQVTDKAVEALAQAPILEMLTLSNTQITDKAAEALAQAPILQTLYLSNTQVTDKAAEALAQAPILEMLSVDNTQVTVAGVRALAAAEGFSGTGNGHLRTLSLDGTPALAQDDGLRAVYEDPGDKDRTEAVFDYARDWVGPVDPTKSPDLDDVFTIVADDGVVNIVPLRPDAEEQQDPI